MAEKKPPTREQRKRASWLQAMLDNALADADSKCWDVVDTAWNRAIKYDTQTKRVAACLGALQGTGVFLAKVQGREGFEAYEPAMVLRDLCAIEPAFSDVSAKRARLIMRDADLAPRSKRGGNGKPGPWNVLARLAFNCGALGCDVVKTPSSEQINNAINRWKRSGARLPHGSMKTARSARTR